MNYQEFIRSKVRESLDSGFEPSLPRNSLLKDWQSRCVDWLVRKGRASLFAGTGMGKTVIQLEWARHVWDHEKKPVILFTPVGVRQQTKREADKFNIDCPVSVVDEQSGIVNGINLVNYEKLHKFDSSVFCGVVLDESQILKNYTGVTKRALCEAFKLTPYRLGCTATPAPNDHMELGNHAEFLGVMPSNEMLARWFINDTMKAGGYRLRHHARGDFWKWVSSWAICISKPSDIGGSDEGYILPELRINRHVVQVAYQGQADGYLIDTRGISATNIHEEKRRSNSARAAKVAELVAGYSGSILVWCNTDYEADELMRCIPGAIEVRGSMKESLKESRLHGFANGEIRVLVTKPEIAGVGLNLQICSKQIFAGIGFSFELYYQAIRRSWRFGQSKPVEVDIVLSDAESTIEKTIARKETDHQVMQEGMVSAVQLANDSERLRAKYVPQSEIVLPKWISN